MDINILIKVTHFALPPYFCDRSIVVISIHTEDTQPWRRLQQTYWVGRNELIKCWSEDRSNDATWKIMVWNEEVVHLTVHKVSVICIKSAASRCFLTQCICMRLRHIQFHCSSNTQSRYNGRPSRQMKAALPLFNGNSK